MTFEREVIPEVNVQYGQGVYNRYPNSPRVLLIYISVFTSATFNRLLELSHVLYGDTTLNTAYGKATILRCRETRYDTCLPFQWGNDGLFERPSTQSSCAE